MNIFAEWESWNGLKLSREPKDIMTEAVNRPPKAFELEKRGKKEKLWSCIYPGLAKLGIKLFHIIRKPSIIE